MHLESPKITLEKSAQEVYEFLAQLSNFESLMPENTDKFELINENRFLFSLKGMPEIVLEKKTQTPYSQLILGAASEKLPFSLKAELITLSEESTEVQLIFDGEFNAMMTMMVKGPLTKFLDSLIQQLQLNLS
jgi:hypothetical protein